MVKLRNHIAEKNQKLLLAICSRSFLGSGVSNDFEDFVQVAWIGLLRAVEKYDPDHYVQANFSTYAHMWIRQAISRYRADTDSGIRVPVHIVEQVNLLRSIEGEFTARHLRDPVTPEELAEFCGLSPETVKRLWGIRSRQQLASINAEAYGVDSNIPMIDILPSDSKKDLSYCVIAREEELLPDGIEIEDVKATLELLPVREHDILVLRSHEHTLEDISVMFGMTRERVRQLERRALRTVRMLLGFEADLNHNDHCIRSTVPIDVEALRQKLLLRSQNKGKKRRKPTNRRTQLRGALKYVLAEDLKLREERRTVNALRKSLKIGLTKALTQERK